MLTESFQRLPRFCRPLRYAIQLKPCLDTFTFDGKETISLDVAQATSEFVLNQANLNVTHATLDGNAVEIVHKSEVEKVSFRLDKPCSPGLATLDISFTGKISDKMNGLYKSVYTDDNGVNKVMLATHFEPTSARRAFPCWDEPDFKSIFSITLVVPSSLTAISNMPLLSKTEQCDGCAVHVFQDSPKMSSYLVAFAIGEMEYVEARDRNGVLVRVYSRPGLVTEAGRGELALDTACRSLPFFGDYFGVRYPLPKCDMLAIPDFSGGAMENWGLVTYRERTLLAEKDTASPGSKQSIALTVSHELAHMWFGNLVTMEWWTDLWLKEGFATWIEYLCTNHCFPEMDIWTHFTYGELACALRLDALANSHPIEVEVSNPDEIDEIFDTISYSKGSSLIHMLHAYLGDEAFRAGLCSYLANHAYANATTEDLWNALGSASGLPVASIMRPWTQKAGFPVVSVEPFELRDKHIRVKLEQRQYRLPSTSPNTPKEPQLWPVPVVFTCRSADGQHMVTYKHLFTSASEVVDIPLTWTASSIDDCLVQINADGTGFYHACYTEQQLYRFARLMKSLNWSVAAKFTFINDGFALAKAGFIRISDWLAVLPQLVEGERSYAVWQCVLNDGLAAHVRRLVHEGELSVSAYHSFLRRLVRPVLDSLDFFPTGDSAPAELSHDARLLRSLLVRTAGAEAGDNDVIAEAQRRFDLYRRDPNPSIIPGDLRVAILSTVVRHGSHDVVDYLMEAYRLAKSPEERPHILSALGAAREVSGHQDGGDPAEPPHSPLLRVLKFCLDPNGPVRDQDRIHGLQVCASWSHASRVATWEAVKEDWPHLSDIYHGQFLLAFLIKGVLSGFGMDKYVADVKAFFDKTPVSCPRAVKQVFETMEINQMLLRRDASLVDSVLTNLSKAGGVS
ncbi:Puromycin-sensitive aminopeptidase [Clonorchis sinensis]|uniref:Aminopeptidase n=1 Tax=Clonorchis sinensis TaxID=79923 RepID=A0A8T1MXS2_CLOSI|nr:Puromycin-sensitive aminopeptidase [Clonorchis sinensis]